MAQYGRANVTNESTPMSQNVLNLFIFWGGCIVVMMVLRFTCGIAARSKFILSYPFPPGVLVGLQRKYPHLNAADHALVEKALRQYFLVYLKSGRKYVSMPSQAVDEVWHEFILNTRAYTKFCRNAFGRFMHHTPAVVMTSHQRSNEGLRRCWWYACREENIDPKNPLSLPLLFAIDRQLNIPDGFNYVPDCKQGTTHTGSDSMGGGTVHCGGDFSDTCFDGSSSGFGDCGDGSGDGGDGGDSGSCGGGCGGGGD